MALDLPFLRNITYTFYNNNNNNKKNLDSYFRCFLVAFILIIYVIKNDI